MNIYGKSIKFKKQKNFQNSLVQSIAGGNTMLWTRKFNNILKKLNLQSAASHDWMIYQVCTMLNLKFVYLERPLVLYRQHGKNNIGANTGFKNMLYRIVWGFKGRFKRWHDQNYFHLLDVSNKFKISEKNKKILFNFYNDRKIQNPLFRFYKIFIKNKIRRQTLQGNIMFILALFLNKV